MNHRYNPDQIGGAVFLIGLGIIAFLNYWWPGIMFRGTASSARREWVETDGKAQFLQWAGDRCRRHDLIGLVGFININWAVVPMC
jgi:hypothetical protein